MAAPNILDLAARTSGMTGRDKARRWVPTKAFHPGGSKGKLHRELGIPESRTIPARRLEQAAHSPNPEIRHDAIRARTMQGWHRPKHGGFYD